MPGDTATKTRFKEALQAWQTMGRPRCYLIGGYVRDRLLGRASADLDFTVEGDAAAVEAPARQLARAYGVRPHLLGQAPRCVWRIDSKNHLKVELWPMGELSLEEDIQRRDFTCNAIALSFPEQSLIDMVGGISDLKARRLRAISRSNLVDDPVRLLRAARFLADLGRFELAPETRQAVAELAPSLAQAPRERVGQEMVSLLRAGHVSRGLQSLIELGLLAPAAPPEAPVDAPWLHANLQAATSLSGATRHPLPAAVHASGVAACLALLLHAWGVSHHQQVAAYCWSRPLRMAATTAANLLKESLATVSLPAADRRQLIHRAGEAFPVVLALAAAVAADTDSRLWQRWWQQWRRCGPSLIKPRLLIPAAEISKLTGATGKDLGKQIHNLVAAQVSGTVRTPGGARKYIVTSCRT
jgi:tRNA nucleotidyltransferase/poly(A) polymerase